MVDSVRVSTGLGGRGGGRHWRMFSVMAALLSIGLMAAPCSGGQAGANLRTRMKYNGEYPGGRTYYNGHSEPLADQEPNREYQQQLQQQQQQQQQQVMESSDAAAGEGKANQKTTFLVPRTDKIQIAFTDGGREIQHSLHTDLLKLYKSVMEQLLERDQFIQTMKTLIDKTALLDNLAERVRRLELRVSGRHIDVEPGPGGSNVDQDNSVNYGGGGDNRGGGSDGGRRNPDDRMDNVAKKVRRQQEDITKLQEEQQSMSKLFADQQLELQRHRDFTGKMQQNIGKMELEISRNKQMTIAQAELLDHHANKMETQRSTSEVIDAKVATQASKVQWHDFRLGMIENVTSRLDSDYISMQLSFGEFHTTQRKIYGLVEKLQTDTERCHVNVATAKMKVRFLEQDVDKLLTIVEKLTPANVTYHASSSPTLGGGRRVEGHHNTSTLAGSARIQVQEMIDRSVGPLDQAISHINTTIRHVERDNNRQQKQIDKASLDIETMDEEARSYLRELRAIGSRVDNVRSDIDQLESENDRTKRKLNKVEKEVREHDHGPYRWTPTSSPSEGGGGDVATDSDHHARTTVGHLRRTTRSLDDVTPVAHGEDIVTAAPGSVGGTQALVTPSNRPKSLTTEGAAIKVTTKPVTENDADKGTTHHTRPRKPDTAPSQSPDNCTVTGFGPAKVVRLFYRILTGMWMKDPARPADKRIYVMRTSFKVSNVREYANETMVVHNIPTVVHHMPHKCTGTGHIIYDGSVYCARVHSNRIVRYNLQSKASHSERLRNAAHNNTYPYASGAYSDIDLAVDENGVWAIYGTKADEGLITISKLDPDDLTTKGTWVTDYNKTEAVNAFMVCGRLYVVGQRSGQPLEVVYAYDTRTGSEMTLRPRQITFRESNPDNSMSLDYNPTDRRLYAWNLSKSFDGLLVKYDVRFQGQS